MLPQPSVARLLMCPSMYNMTVPDSPAPFMLGTAISTTVAEMSVTLDVTHCI